MGEIDMIWHRYNLLRNPYFTEPLTIADSVIPIETLVGRKKEKQEIISTIGLGGGTRFLVIGEAGVGKTSLINYVRSIARKNLIFTPINEIKIQDGSSPTQLVVDILQNLYNEIKAQNIKIKDQSLLLALEDLFELSRILVAEDVNPEAVLSLNLTQVTNLYNKTANEIIQAGGYRAILIHLNNFDNIDEMENYDKLFNNLRDFLQNKNTIFIFVGFDFLPYVINSRPKVRQIFANLPIKIGKLSFDEIMKIIESRLSHTKFSDRDCILPHSKDSIKVLYELYGGNARDILNSLATSVKAINKTTTKPILIDATKLKEILHTVANERFLTQISPNEKQVLQEIIKIGKITNSELSINLKKQRQHISSYLKKLEQIQAIKLETIKGTKRYYIPTTEALWFKFKIGQIEIKEQKAKEETKIEKIRENLKDWV